MNSKKESKKTKNIAIFLGVLVLIVVVYAVYVNVLKTPKYPTTYIPTPYTGNSSAKVVITEYSDFECPACGSAEPIVRTLRSEYQDKVAFRYVNFPLVNIHANAFKAAEAVECANDQGKFWEYHDKLFDNQKALQTDSVIDPKFYYDIASSLGLDVEKFKQCLDSDAKKQAVTNEFNEAVSTNLKGTPSFFVNNISVDNYAYDNFKKIIDQELSK